MDNLQNNNRNEEEIIRSLLKKSCVNAPENLQYRIMRQVESAHALTPQKARGNKPTTNILADFKIIFGIMYGAIIAVGAGFYFLQGGESLKSWPFIFTVVGIASLFSLFWLMTRLDSFLKEKYRRKHALQKGRKTA